MRIEIPGTGVLYLVYRLAFDTPFYDRFKTMSLDQKTAVLDAAGVDVTGWIDPCTTTGTQEEYKTLYGELEAFFRDVNAQFDHQKYRTIIFSLGAFIHHPTTNPDPPPEG